MFVQGLMILIAVSGQGFVEACRTQKTMLSQQHSQIAVFAV